MNYNKKHLRTCSFKIRTQSGLETSLIIHTVINLSKEKAWSCRITILKIKLNIDSKPQASKYTRKLNWFSLAALHMSYIYIYV